MQYFGTTLTEAGHYFFDLTRGGFSPSQYRFSDTPFNPENLPIGDIAKGEEELYHAFGYTILAIMGSPYDKRGGSKSIFFVKGTIDHTAFIEAIMKSESAKAIYTTMKSFLTNKS